MNKIIFSVISMLLLLIVIHFSFCSMPGNGPFSGIWRMDFQGNGSVIISTYFDLEQNGKELKGQVVMNNAVEIPIENVVVSDTMASFTIFWGARFDLYPREGHMEVHTSWHGGTPLKSTAVSAGKEEIVPPETIAPPEIEKVSANGLALTPPMGWNSWNYFKISISDSIVREIADAMVQSGMADAGYEYIVIDDGWEGGRDADGNIYPNEHFPDMKALADYVHSLGLKLGIYSSPGPRTCGGYEGSYGHEFQDAKTFAEWGIDYLKYDWCGAMRIYGYSQENMQAVYQVMGNALLECGRPIVYSICQYGIENVWEWGEAAGGNLWRTTGDIHDSWEKISEIGFNQHELAPFAGPGHWNDPDMLEVGNGDLTQDENKSHFTLWCMLAAPLMAGNDLRNMSKETLSILTNKDLIAINQDRLGKQAERIAIKDSVEVWSKPLADGSRVIALFNRNTHSMNAAFNWEELGVQTLPKQVKDVWHQKKLRVKLDGVSQLIPGHGVVLLTVK